MRGRKYPLRGNNYRSKFEKGLATSLHHRHVKFEYEGEFINYAESIHAAICNECNGTNIAKLRRYLPDFYIPKTNIYIEAKGRFTGDARTKMLAVVTTNPNIDLRMVFQRDDWFNKKHATRYSDWCKKHNIEYAVGEIPDEWVGVTEDDYT